MNRKRIPIGCDSVSVWASTLSDEENRDMWAFMSDDGDNRVKYLLAYASFMHNQYLNSLDDETRLMEELKGVDLDKYLL